MATPRDQAPSWAPNAVATEKGWEDPNTGELLVAMKGLKLGAKPKPAPKKEEPKVEEPVVEEKVEEPVVEEKPAPVKKKTTTRKKTAAKKEDDSE